jgi:hypothetical protein
MVLAFRPRSLLVVLALVAVGAPRVRAQATEPPAPAARNPHAPFDEAPLPDQASGILVPRERRHRWLWLPRAVLFVPRWALEVPFALPRLGLWTYDRYQLADRFHQIFFSDTGDVGVYPVAFFETGFGLNVGARLIHRNLFDRDVKLRLRASHGGQYRQLYAARVDSGNLIARRAALELEVAYEQFPKSRFVGLGNADQQAFVPGMAPIDPLTDDAAVETRFRHDDVRVALAVVGRLTDRVWLRPSGALRLRSFDPDADLRGDADIRDAYDTSRLVGYEDGSRTLYTEVDLTYDSRRGTAFHLSAAAPSTGWRVTGFLGYQQGLADDPSQHLRWGIDVQRYLDLYRGDRVLTLRAYTEGVTGDLAAVPFVDLPRLGGPLFLRGYERDRFRDRALTLACAEYGYPLDRNVGAYVFVDAGRVWREIDQVDLDGWRIGFGAGLQAHTMRTFLARVFVASSIDGGLLLHLGFDPVFDARSREEKP